MLHILMTSLETNIDQAKLLEEIENGADEAKNLKKQPLFKESSDSNRELWFDASGLNQFSIKYNLIKIINSSKKTYQDLKDYCSKLMNNSGGVRKAYNIIQGLESDRDFRADTVDLICGFLNLKIELEQSKISEPIIEEEKQQKSKPIRINITNEDAPNLVKVISDYINSHNFYYSDLIKFYMSKGSESETESLRKAYNTVQSLKDGHNVRASTLEALCEFMNIDLVMIFLDNKNEETN